MILVFSISPLQHLKIPNLNLIPSGVWVFRQISFNYCFASEVKEIYVQVTLFLLNYWRNYFFFPVLILSWHSFLVKNIFMYVSPKPFGIPSLCELTIYSREDRLSEVLLWPCAPIYFSRGSRIVRKYVQSTYRLGLLKVLRFTAI